MIKTTYTRKDGTVGLLVGLSRINTEKLLAGEPIFFDMSEVGAPDKLGSIAIVGGETEESIVADLRNEYDVNFPVPGNGTVN